MTAVAPTAAEGLSTANGHSVLEATVYLPRAGVWHADLVVDTQTPADVTGAIALSLLDGQLVLEGTSYRPPLLWRGLTRLRMVAGAAGLGTLLPAQGYADSPASVIVSDILRGAVGPAGASETLAATSMSLATRMRWCRLAGERYSAGAALRAIVLELGADVVWRSLPDGTIWIGTETWPASTFTDFEIMDAHPEDSRLELVTGTPGLLPGTTLLLGDDETLPGGGGNVGRVVYRLTPDTCRAEVFFE